MDIIKISWCTVFIVFRSVISVYENIGVYYFLLPL